MNVNDISNSNNLKVDDLQAKKVAVTIEAIEMKEFTRKDGNGVDRKFVMSLEGKIKRFVCNITNARMIAMLTDSNDTDDWIGRRIYLQPTMTPLGPGIGVASELPQDDYAPSRKKSMLAQEEPRNAVGRNASAADREIDEDVRPDYLDDDTEVAF